MSEKKEFTGFWWLPDNPDLRIPGLLTLVPFSEAYIELQGDLRNIAWGEDFNPPILLGISSNGKFITLERCLLANRTHSFSGFPTARFLVHKVYIGVHFDKPENIHFKNAVVRYVNLDEWANYKSFQAEQSSNPLGFTIQYKQPVTTIANIDEYDIYFGAGWSINESRSRISLIEKASISINSTGSERPIDDFATMVRHFQNFLSLAMGTPTFPTEIISHTEKSKRELKDGKEIYDDIDVYYSAIGWSNDPKRVNWFEMLFTLPEIKDRISLLISNWLKEAEALAPVFNLFFSILYNTTYVESMFLSITQAIETFHRRIYGGKYQEDEEYMGNLYQRFVEVIPKDIDNGFKQSLRNGKLKYANEYSLRKRLQVLINHLIKNNLLFDFIVPKEKAFTFVEKVCNTRNYLTHYDSSLQNKAARGIELYLITMHLRGILEILLLEKIGFECDQIREMINKNQGIKYRLGIE